MADARVVSNYLVDLADEAGKTITPMQSLKLVYLAHGFSLALRGKPLIHNRIEAWKYGPVIPDLYHAIKDWGDQPIGKVTDWHLEALTTSDKELLRSVYNVYSELSGVALSSLTHQPGTPWDISYRPGSFGELIPNHVIAVHYRDLARRVS